MKYLAFLMVGKKTAHPTIIRFVAIEELSVNIVKETVLNLQAHFK